MDLVVAFVSAVVPTLGGLFLYLRHRDRLRFYQHVYDKGGAKDAVDVMTAFNSKTHPELEAGSWQERRADGPGAARAPRTGRRPRRRDGEDPQPAIVSSSKSDPGRTHDEGPLGLWRGPSSCRYCSVA